VDFEELGTIVRDTMIIKMRNTVVITVRDTVGVTVDDVIVCIGARWVG